MEMVMTPEKGTTPDMLGEVQLAPVAAPKQRNQTESPNNEKNGTQAEMEHNR